MELSFYTNFESSLTLQETQLNTLEQQVATGVSVQTPDQNPTAYETAVLGTDQISALNSNSTTLGDIQGQLGGVNNVYQSVSTLLDNVQGLVEQALNGTTSAQNMKSLATQVTSAGQQLLGLANTTGTNGTYLFGGTRGNMQPFQTQPDGSVAYMGDGGQSLAAISSDLSAATIANGETFMTGLQGNGYSYITAGAGNTGDAQVLSDGVTSPTQAAQFQTGGASIGLTFTPNAAGGFNYTATSTAPITSTGTGAGTGSGTNTVTGTVTSGGTIPLDGMEFQLNGTPTATDTFTIAPSQPQSAFSLLQNIANTLQNTGTTSAAVAQTNQQLNQDLSGLAQYQQSVVTATAQTGVTLQSVTNTENNNTTQQNALQTSVQNAIAVNMPQAMTNLNETLTSVQAAMKAFSSVQSLSLFSYI